MCFYEFVPTLGAAKKQLLALICNPDAVSFGEINLAKGILDHDIVYFRGRLLICRGF